MPRAFRIAKCKHSLNKGMMLSGRGALLYGGRWNSPGRAVVYASQSLSLATLEVVVHLNAAEKIMAYRSMALEIPDELVLPMDPADLPADWDAMHVEPKAAQSWGDAWFDDRISAVLEVPSVIIPSESNYLINPEHTDFDQIRCGPIEKHCVDRRIKE